MMGLNVSSSCEVSESPYGVSYTFCVIKSVWDKSDLIADLNKVIRYKSFAPH